MHTREIRGYKNPIIPILNLTKHNDTFFILEGIQHTQSIVNWFPMIIQVQLTDHNFCGDHTWLENVWSINLVDVLSIHNLDSPLTYCESKTFKYDYDFICFQKYFGTF